jgi:hypothetical protein
MTTRRGNADAEPSAFPEPIAAVNLDELVADTITVPFIEFVPYEAESPLGPETRYRAVERQAEICTLVSTELELEALALYTRINQEHLPEPVVLRGIAECVLKAWQVSEPSMTLPRLLKGIGGSERLLKLFSLFFTPPSRRQQRKAASGNATR